MVETIVYEIRISATIMDLVHCGGHLVTRHYVPSMDLTYELSLQDLRVYRGSDPGLDRSGQYLQHVPIGNKWIDKVMDSQRATNIRAGPLLSPKHTEALSKLMTLAEQTRRAQLDAMELFE